MLVLASVFVSLASAGSGPWVVGEGQASLYVGGEAQRLSQLAITVEGERDVIDVAEGISTVGLKGIATVGLTPRIELQGILPWWRVQATRPDHPLCEALGLGACRTTSSLGVVELRGKGLVLDEFFGAPVSLALGAEMRLGDFTYGTRERVTNVGEGALDAGAFLAVGRTGAVGARGYWSAYLEVLGRYRAPTTRDFPEANAGRSVPGSEFGATAEWVVGPRSRVAFGPVASVLWRPWGKDFGELDLTDRDRFGALRILTTRVGGTLAIRGPESLVATLSVLRTVVAINNPSDVLTVSGGVQTLIGRGRRGESGG